MVVIMPPGGEHRPGLEQAGEDGPAQALVAQNIGTVSGSVAKLDSR